MNLLDWIVIGIVFACTAGVLAGRIAAQIVEFRVQRRVARLLRRNADLLERETLHRSPRTR